MDKIDRMRAFAWVARERSFTAAGLRLGKSTRLVSKYVADLEADLGVQLLHRTTRSVALTDIGVSYLALCEPLLEGFDELEESVRRAQTALKGTIRVAAPTGFGALRLTPTLAKFGQLHPDVEIDLQLSDQRVDLISDGFDLAIRIGPMRDSSLVARPLGPMPLITCAAPSYLANAGMPAHPQDIAHHECVLDGNMAEPNVWRFDVEGQVVSVAVSGRFRTNSPAASARLATAGTGIVRCPAYTVTEALRSGELTELFAAYRSTTYTVAVWFPQNRRLTSRVRALIEHLAADPDLLKT